MEAFAWSIEDIKGISPLVCMHEILMEEEYTMKKVVEKEVCIWLIRATVGL